MTDGSINAASAVTLFAEMERTSRRRVLLLSIGFAGVLACLAAFLIIVHNQRNDAEARAKRFERTANEVARTLEQARQAYSRQDMPEVGRQLGAAIVQAETLAQKAAAPAEGSQVVVAPPPAPSVRPKPAGEPPTYQLETIDPALRRRVYIQFAGSIARENVVGLNRALTTSGWTVEGGSGERTVKSAGLNEVRYRNEQDRQAAQALADAVTASGIAARPLTPKQVSIIQPGELEVWMSR
ncbi:hypothetical protein [Phenylobacterium sp.]|uniref:hypothetical protein n=1 Tax=Phenylobacterium sp. TaxID=1871053 RepID=UPI0030F3E3A3